MLAEEQPLCKKQHVTTEDHSMINITILTSINKFVIRVIISASK